jgi:hypothetical protein
MWTRLVTWLEGCRDTTAKKRWIAYLLQCVKQLHWKAVLTCWKASTLEESQWVRGDQLRKTIDWLFSYNEQYNMLFKLGIMASLREHDMTYVSIFTNMTNPVSHLVTIAGVPSLLVHLLGWASAKSGNLFVSCLTLKCHSSPHIFSVNFLFLWLLGVNTVHWQVHNLHALCKPPDINCLASCNNHNEQTSFWFIMRKSC